VVSVLAHTATSDVLTGYGDKPMDGQRPPANPLLGGESEYVSAQTTVIGKPQRAIGHQGELTQGPAVCQTDRRRPLRRGRIGFPIGFPTGWPLRKWLVRQRVCCRADA
jgi:hypothetical protein